MINLLLKLNGYGVKVRLKIVGDFKLRNMGSYIEISFIVFNANSRLWMFMKIHIFIVVRFNLFIPYTYTYCVVCTCCTNFLQIYKRPQSKNQ